MREKDVQTNFKNFNIIVIGAGLGGLAAAIRMQAAGYKVILLEKTDQIGGKASVIKNEGYTIDIGPTAVTVPHLIEELFELNNEKMTNYIELLPVEPYFRIYFTDKTIFDYSIPEKNIKQIEKINSNDINGYKKLLKAIEPIFQKGFIELSDKSFESFFSMIKIAFPLLRLKAYKSVYSYVSGYLKDEKLRKVFSYHPLLIGGNPFKVTAIYMLVQAVEKEWGVWFVKGGTSVLVEALGNLFKRMGGTLKVNFEVEEIICSEKGVVKGVRTIHGDIINAPIVISNAPVATTYMKLIDNKFRKKNKNKRYSKANYSMSAFMIYCGTETSYPNLHIHNILLGESYKGLVDLIFNKKQLPKPNDFSAYLYAPTRMDPTLAPEGGESFYILVPVPNQDSHIDWEIEKESFAEKILQYLEVHYLPNLRENLKYLKILTPLDFEKTHLDFKGAVFSLSPSFTQSAYFRPHNKSEDIEGLYIVGAGTHPGGGIPGVIISAKLTCELINKTLLK